MEEKLFVIAIGGTGMRCLESFVHLCAIGMFDNKEIEILTLDTDQANGNMERTWNLINTYNQVKSENGRQNGGTPNTNTFFSSKLNIFKFFINYSSAQRNTYKNISKLGEGDERTNRHNQMISDLFLEKETVQEFNLDHGYRAQTHLGSHLMYHGILEAASKIKNGDDLGKPEIDLKEFLAKLQSAGESARVFVFGSVFGGTGASSIPIIPVAFREAIGIIGNDNEKFDPKKIKFGSTLLTEYFSFNKPNQNQLSEKKNSVIADSSFFPINSQAALQFYQNDPTVQSVYNKMYHIGWPVESKSLLEEKNNNTITGGSTQKNNCHILELMCAAAAFEFFNTANYEKTDKIEYLFRAIKYENGIFELTSPDFVGSEKGDLFLNKIGAFLSFAHIVLSKNEGGNGLLGTKGFITQLDKNNIKDYNTITDAETKQIDEYLKLFAYSFSSENLFVPGWIYQIRNSILPGNFLFNKDAFKDSLKELRNLDVGNLFLDNKHNWNKTLFNSRYDVFISKLTNEGKPELNQNVNSTKEKFLAHIHNGIMISQNFIKK